MSSEHQRGVRDGEDQAARNQWIYMVVVGIVLLLAVTFLRKQRSAFDPKSFDNPEFDDSKYRQPPPKPVTRPVFVMVVTRGSPPQQPQMQRSVESYLRLQGIQIMPQGYQDPVDMLNVMVSVTPNNTGLARGRWLLEVFAVGGKAPKLPPPGEPIKNDATEYYWEGGDEVVLAGKPAVTDVMEKLRPVLAKFAAAHSRQMAN